MIYYQRQLDSLKRNSNVTGASQYLVNPNYISDYRAYSLGIPPDAYDRLRAYIHQGNKIKTAAQFQTVNQLSDTAMIRLVKKISFSKERKSLPKKTVNVLKHDINLATANDLQRVKGIGEILSQRIVKYRSFLKGFSLEDQFYEVYGLDSLVVERLKLQFEIVAPPKIIKLLLSEASLQELKSVPYLNEDEARKIIAYRTKTKKVSVDILSELFKYSPNKIKRLELYLQ